MKTVPMATLISLSSTPITDPTAAMADPPQIAEPAEISAETLRSILSRLPMAQPNPS
jgi:hypothetical protein